MMDEYERVAVSAAEAGHDAVAEPADRSLPADVRSLIEIARTYAAAEVAFQKSRVSYASEQARSVLLRGVIAGVLVFFALMGGVFGLILGLTPWLTAWGAMAVVVGVLLIGAWLSWRGARAGIRALSGAFASATPATEKVAP